MTTLLAQGLDRIATPMMRDQAAEVLYLSATGHSTLEIGREMGVKWPYVNLLRDVAGDALIGAMRDEGRDAGEIVRTLGVPTARVA